jgi:hypothetical protein
MIERVGAELRGMMPWLQKKDTAPGAAQPAIPMPPPEPARRSVTEPFAPREERSAFEMPRRSPTDAFSARPPASSDDSGDAFASPPAESSDDGFTRRSDQESM